ncbi:MAG TPA: apolipoprotein N-acyltransferase [Trebonia sp.]|nr:apolipoprotein N-acyltransferase [Trebonia sp.]
MIIGQPDADPDGTDTNAAVPDGTAEEPRAAQRPLLRLRWALPVALAGGLLLTAAFPSVGVWPLAVVGPALLVLALFGRSLRAAFAVGLVFGLAFFFPLLAWVINLAWFAWVALAIASALIFAVFAVAQRLLLNLRWWPLAVAGWWVAAEAFRDRWPWGGFPWGRLAMSQAGLPTQGWAAIGGAPVLSFVVALTGTTLAWVMVTVLTGWAGPIGGRAARWGRTAIAAVAFAATAGVSCLPAALPLDPVPANAKTAEVAAIQGNVPRARSLEAQIDELQVTRNHATATEKLAAEVAAGTLPRPDLVIWPENSTSIDPTQYPPIYDEIANAATAIGRPILVGAVLQDPSRNASLLWLPGKGPTTTYLKRRLVPFGEYVPFRSLISKITSLTQLNPTDFVPGHQTVVFDVGQIRLGAVICYEVAFDDLVRSEVDAGSNVLTVQSNDATFEREGPTSEESEQQLAMAQIRAVEFDRAVIYDSTTGYSAVIAPDGHIVERSGLWQQAELEARVPLLTYTTLADRLGAWPEWAIVGATALALCLAAGQAAAGRRRPRGPRSADSPSGAVEGR